MEVKLEQHDMLSDLLRKCIDGNETIVDVDIKDGVKRVEFSRRGWASISKYFFGGLG